MEEKKTFAEVIKEKAGQVKGKIENWVADNQEAIVYCAITAVGVVAGSGMGYFAGRWHESQNQTLGNDANHAWFELGKIAGHAEVMDAIADGSIEVENT